MFDVSKRNKNKEGSGKTWTYIYRQSWDLQAFTLAGPNVTGLVPDPLAVLSLNNQKFTSLEVGHQN